MPANTTNFNIAYPLSTDLVKDGATAIQTVADGYDSRFGDIATYPSQIVNRVGLTTSRPLPYAMSTGRFNMSGTSVANNGNVTASVTFTRSTRFTEAPMVVVTQTGLPSGSGSLIPKATSVGTTGFTAALYNVSGGVVSWTNAQIDFMAVQMTLNASANS